ncbi:2Fe-2S iron-sulfur cluster-binding protein [Noviherbaspirillum sp.]|uniref:2Fe-2S iron-sulfur cluster-binding protein n=1 Tax=Noviherbaspirillum sp. TaxID=1926288 RepID=UPI002D6DB889|nr:2Fe-2S iron-sulfur cluster-binding protein [Noviherbaspirillum sp.]HZW21475.1 2Fe-2S iron-sulfur cluster-binding protein [Noviherbaspirillum sp.]
MSDTARFSALVRPAGLRFDAPASSPLLTAARQAGIELPASCRNGTCRTCMCRLASGRIRYRIDWPGLTREEKAEGFILPCVAYPESDVELEVPAFRGKVSG